jgi:hypothetical protein
MLMIVVANDLTFDMTGREPSAFASAACFPISRAQLVGLSTVERSPTVMPL